MSTELWLRLSNAQISANFGSALIDRFGNPEDIFDASAHDVADLTGYSDSYFHKLQNASCIPSQSQIDFHSKNEISILPRNSADYPISLKEIDQAPPLLFVRGRFDERDRFAVGLVGSRSATPYGKSVAGKFARELCNAGLTIVSGGAMGIDTSVHHGAMDAGGRTIVVLGCGLDIPYPRDNQKLFDQIVERDLGAIITEFPPGTQPEAWRFPLRNRIISGLSMGIVVIEAGIPSGALSTASCAAEQGRDVMAIPGNIDRDASRGTNGLIKDGAILVDDPADVLRTLGVLVMKSPTAAPIIPVPNTTHLPESQRKILEKLSLTPRHIDALAADLHMSSTDVSVQMTLMELSGLIRRLPGNCYIRILN